MTGESPVVSVITASHNSAAHLTEAIGSVLDQTLRSVELIVVDDASSDASVALVQAAAARDARVKLLIQPRNGGPGAARNRAIAQARGRFIAVFDSDDLMEPDRLARLVGRAQLDGAELVADNLLAFEDGKAASTGRPFLPEELFRALRWASMAEVIRSSRMYAARPGLGYLKPLISAASLRAAGVRYNEELRVGEDYDFLLRLMASGLKLRLEPAAFYFYRRHSASTSSALQRNHLEAMLRADAAFDVQFPSLPADVRRAQAERRRSLERALAYDKVVEGLKRGDLGGVLAHGFGGPRVWPLLVLPVRARLRRLASRLQPA